MVMQLNVSFENRDAADGALRQLRRSGIDFRVTRLHSNNAVEREWDGGASILFPYSSSYAINEPIGMMPESMGSRAIMSAGQVLPSGYDREAELVLTLDERYAPRAQSLLRNAHGYSIRERR